MPTTPLKTTTPEDSTRVFVGLGSNLESPVAQLETACKTLRENKHLHQFRCSPFYRSIAVGPPQPDYINAVACFRTLLSPLDLLRELQAIENAQHRVRTEHWGPRTLDLDILLYGDRVITTTELCIPHPRLADRNFVLQPLCDLDNTLQLPDGSQVSMHLQKLGLKGLHKLNDNERTRP